MELTKDQLMLAANALLAQADAHDRRKQEHMNSRSSSRDAEWNLSCCRFAQSYGRRAADERALANEILHSLARAKLDGDRTSVEGLTWQEWLEAAGGAGYGARGTVQNLRRAWELGEDPSEYRV